MTLNTRRVRGRFCYRHQVGVLAGPGIARINRATCSGSSSWGRSAGLTPLRIFPTQVPIRRHMPATRPREKSVRNGLSAGGRWIRTTGPAARRDWPFRDHLDRPLALYLRGKQLTSPEGPEVCIRFAPAESQIQSRSEYTAVLKGGCPDAGLHPDQATRHILGHGVLLPVRESPPGSKSASMIGQHRPLSQSAENHLSRGHGCSNVQQSRPTSRAPKN